MAVAVGIDLGTTNTVVGAVKDGWPITLVDEANRRLLPSIVSFHPSGRVLVGHSARERRIVDATNTVASVKRLLGRPWTSLEVQRAARTMPFELVEGEGHEVLVEARGERYTLPEISAFILRRAKAIAENALGQPVRQAVIAVPANFNDLQREATKLAGKLAGLDVLRILSEPTAAALAYGESVGKKERVAVYDLGGGTFDVTLLDVSGSVFQVLATGGDTALGGDDIDELVARLMTDSLLRQFHYDARTDPTARATLKVRAEELKILLSSNASGEISLDKIVRGDGGAFLPASFRLDRRVLETLASPLIERTLETSRRALEKVGMAVTDVDRVLLVGGSTRMPLVGRRVEEYFERKVSARVNPDEVVAHGAAIQAASLARGDEVARPSLRPKPSFSFAPGVADATPRARLQDQPHEPRMTPRVGEVVVPLPPKVPGDFQVSQPSLSGQAPSPSRPPPPVDGSYGSARPSRPPPPPVLPGRASAPPMPSQSAPRASAPPISQDQEALLRAFLDVHAATTPVPDEPTVPAASVKPPKEAAIETELIAFLSDAPPHISDAPVAPSSPATESRPPSMSPAARSVPPLPRSDAPSAPSVKPPKEIAIESELAAFLSDAPPPDAPSEGIVAVVDQPQPAVPVPSLTGLSSRPERVSGIPTLASRPPPVISEQSARAASDGGGPASVSGGPRPPSQTPLLIDVTPLSLGVETVGGFCDVVIRANSPVPCDRNRVFRTASDNQTSVVVRVCQGESDRFLENTTLGDLRLTGFRPAPRGEVEITVTFEIDADGILNVQASEVTTGRTAVARIELLGAQMDPKRMQAMMDRQARREVA